MNRPNAQDTPLWQFACQTYQDAALQKRLLELQDNHHCNVNEILYCMWLDSQDRAIALALLNSRKLRKIKAHIKRVRAVRRAFKGAPLLYNRLKSLELTHEKRHLAALYALTTQPNTSKQTQLNTYCAQHNITWES